MLLRKDQWKILIINFILLVVFGVVFVKKRNYEFLGYIGVIVLILGLIIISNKKVQYPNFVLWGLTIWSFLHLSGGGIKYGGSVLYNWIIIPLVGEPYLIFKYDQLVHIFGFFVAALVMFVVLKPKLSDKRITMSILIVVTMAGLGLGAVNEIVEFSATVLVKDTNVGGYVNTCLDLVADLIGAIFAAILIRYKPSLLNYKN